MSTSFNWQGHQWGDGIVYQPPTQTFDWKSIISTISLDKKFAEYIWIDGFGRLRSKTKVLGGNDEAPEWGFDGSSTNQADTSSSDCILKPVRTVSDSIRGGQHILVLCEVLDHNGNPDAHNNRAKTVRLMDKLKDKDYWFGLEQEYTMFKGARPAGVDGSIMPRQGPYYCGVGADEVTGRQIVEEHMAACLNADLHLSGVNAEVMPGQWEFQIGPANPVEVGDHIWLARYLLYRIAEKYGVTIKLHPKPVKELNGAGMHTNFSTTAMREDYHECVKAARKLGEAVIDEPADLLVEGQRYPTFTYPEEYGDDFELRLTGEHETCSHKEFRFGVSDRGGSVRIPLHVQSEGKGYIEDRRPCANADPYAVVNYIMETVR